MHQKQRTKRFFAMLLALAMVVTSISVPSITVQAEETMQTVSANDQAIVSEEESVSDGDTGTGEGTVSDGDTGTGEGTVSDGDTGTGEGTVSDGDTGTGEGTVNDGDTGTGEGTVSDGDSSTTQDSVSFYREWGFSYTNGDGTECKTELSEKFYQHWVPFGSTVNNVSIQIGSLSDNSDPAGKEVDFYRCYYIDTAHTTNCDTGETTSGYWNDENNFVELGIDFSNFTGTIEYDNGDLIMESPWSGDEVSYVYLEKIGASNFSDAWSDEDTPTLTASVDYKIECDKNRQQYTFVVGVPTEATGVEYDLMGLYCGEVYEIIDYFYRYGGTLPSLVKGESFPSVTYMLNSGMNMTDFSDTSVTGTLEMYYAADMEAYVEGKKTLIASAAVTSTSGSEITVTPSGDNAVIPTDYSGDRITIVGVFTPDTAGYEYMGELSGATEYIFSCDYEVGDLVATVTVAREGQDAEIKTFSNINEAKDYAQNMLMSCAVAEHVGSEEHIDFPDGSICSGECVVDTGTDVVTLTLYGNSDNSLYMSIPFPSSQDKLVITSGGDTVQSIPDILTNVNTEVSNIKVTNEVYLGKWNSMTSSEDDYATKTLTTPELTLKNVEVSIVNAWKDNATVKIINSKIAEVNGNGKAQIYEVSGEAVVRSLSANTVVLSEKAHLNLTGSCTVSGKLCVEGNDTKISIPEINNSTSLWLSGFEGTDCTKIDLSYSNYDNFVPKSLFANASNMPQEERDAFLNVLNNGAAAKEGYENIAYIYDDNSSCIVAVPKADVALAYVSLYSLSDEAANEAYSQEKVMCMTVEEIRSAVEACADKVPTGKETEIYCKVELLQPLSTLEKLDLSRADGQVQNKTIFVTAEEIKSVASIVACDYTRLILKNIDSFEDSELEGDEEFFAAIVDESGESIGFAGDNLEFFSVGMNSNICKKISFGADDNESTPVVAMSGWVQELYNETALDVLITEEGGINLLSANAAMNVTLRDRGQIWRYEGTGAAITIEDEAVLWSAVDTADEPTTTVTVNTPEWNIHGRILVKDIIINDGTRVVTPTFGTVHDAHYDDCTVDREDGSLEFVAYPFEVENIETNGYGELLIRETGMYAGWYNADTDEEEMYDKKASYIGGFTFGENAALTICTENEEGYGTLLFDTDATNLQSQVDNGWLHAPEGDMLGVSDNQLYYYYGSHRPETPAVYGNNSGMYVESGNVLGWNLSFDFTNFYWDEYEIRFKYDSNDEWSEPMNAETYFESSYEVDGEYYWYNCVPYDYCDGNWHTAQFQYVYKDVNGNVLDGMSSEISEFTYLILNEEALSQVSLYDGTDDIGGEIIDSMTLPVTDVTSTQLHLSVDNALSEVAQLEYVVHEITADQIVDGQYEFGYGFDLDYEKYTNGITLESGKYYAIVYVARMDDFGTQGDTYISVVKTPDTMTAPESIGDMIVANGENPDEITVFYTPEQNTISAKMMYQGQDAFCSDSIWTIDNTDIAEITNYTNLGTGSEVDIRIKKDGVVNLTAQSVADVSLSKTVKVTFKEATTGIDVSWDSGIITPKKNVKVTVTPIGGDTLLGEIYNPENYTVLVDGEERDDILTINNKGVIALNKNYTGGAVDVTVRYSVAYYDAGGIGARKNCYFDLAVYPEFVEQIVLSNVPSTIILEEVGFGEYIGVDVLGEDCFTAVEFTYKGSEEIVMEVNDDYGVFVSLKSPSAKAKGTITATALDGSKKKVTCNIKVGTKVRDLQITNVNYVSEVDYQGVILAPGKTFSTKASVYPTNATNKKLTYYSSNPDVATVDAKGKVTAVAPGKAFITVMPEDSAYCGSRDFVVLVKEPADKVLLTVNSDNGNVVTSDTKDTAIINKYEGSTGTFVISKVTGTDGKVANVSQDLTWTVKGGSKGGAISNGDGYFEFTKAGTYTITATTTDGTKKKASVKVKVVQEIFNVTTDMPAKNNGYYMDGDQPVYYIKQGSSIQPVVTINYGDKNQKPSDSKYQLYTNFMNDYSDGVTINGKKIKVASDVPVGTRFEVGVIERNNERTLQLEVIPADGPELYSIGLEATGGTVYGTDDLQIVNGSKVTVATILNEGNSKPKVTLSYTLQKEVNGERVAITDGSAAFNAKKGILTTKGLAAGTVVYLYAEAKQGTTTLGFELGFEVVEPVTSMKVSRIIDDNYNLEEVAEGTTLECPVLASDSFDVSFAGAPETFTHAYTVKVSNPKVVTAVVDEESGSLGLFYEAKGQSKVSVISADGAIVRNFTVKVTNPSPVSKLVLGFNSYNMDLWGDHDDKYKTIYVPFYVNNKSGDAAADQRVTWTIQGDCVGFAFEEGDWVETTEDGAAITFADSNSGTMLKLRAAADEWGNYFTGKAVVTGVTMDGKKKASITINLNENDTVVRGIDLHVDKGTALNEQNVPVLLTGKKLTVNAMCYPTCALNQSLTYIVEACDESGILLEDVIPTGITVNNKGVVKAAKGDATYTGYILVTALANDQIDEERTMGQIMIRVAKPMQSVSKVNAWNGRDVSILPIGGGAELRIKAEGWDGQWDTSGIKLTSSSPLVHVDDVVYPNDEGEYISGISVEDYVGKLKSVKITATALDGSGKKATVTLKLGEVTKSLIITSPDGYLYEDWTLGTSTKKQTLALKVISNPVKPTISGVNWEVDEESKAKGVSISKKGVVTIPANFTTYAESENTDIAIIIKAISKDGYAETEFRIYVPNGPLG